MICAAAGVRPMKLPPWERESGLCIDRRSLSASPRQCSIASRAIAGRLAGRPIFDERQEKWEAFDETASSVRQRFHGGDTHLARVHLARVCRGRRHARAPLGQERVQFRGDAVGPAAVAEFEPASGRQSQCRPAGRRLSQSHSHARSRRGREAKGRARHCRQGLSQCAGPVPGDCAAVHLRDDSSASRCCRPRAATSSWSTTRTRMFATSA